MTNEEAKAFLDNLKICIDEHPIVADWLVEIANRKTEPQTDKGVSYSDHTDYKEPKTYVTWTEPQTERVETMSCQECKHFEVGKPCKPFLNECDCHYEPQTDCSWQKGE